MCCACLRNRDHDDRCAGCFNRFIQLLPSGAISSNPSIRRRSADPSRCQIVVTSDALTSARIRAAISFSVVNPGSSSDAWISRSNATLIRSGGWFFTSAAFRIAFSASLRALPGLQATPTRCRISLRCDSAVRGDRYCGTIASFSSRQRRTWSITASGTSVSFGKRPIRWKLFNSTVIASRCSSASVRSCAHTASSGAGV